MKRLLIIDGNSIMNRAFYANPNFMTSKGQHTGAIYGFINMMIRSVEISLQTMWSAPLTEKPPLSGTWSMTPIKREERECLRSWLPSFPF